MAIEEPENGEGEGLPPQLADLLRQLGVEIGPDGSVDLNSLLRQVQSRLGGPGGLFGPGVSASASGINWEATLHAARQVTASQGPDPSPTAADQRAIVDADRLAELWLDNVCDFPQVSSTAAAWSRAEWVQHTMPSWQSVVEPIVGAIATALGGLIDEQPAEAAGELAGLASMLQPMLKQMAGAMYGFQFASALGTLATQVVSGTEIGLQLLKAPQVVILPANLEAFGAGTDLPHHDVLLYLTLREGSRQRLFNSVGWLAPQILALLEHFARETRIDASALESAVDVSNLTELTPETLAEVSESLQGKLFEPTRTPEQQAILGRLETLLALVEGWVDEVTTQAASSWMPNAPALAETVRRRRGAGGPAENVFGSLVGLELRPRRVRDAVNLWAALTQARGIGGRDAVWHHPDLMPTSEDLDDPLGYAAGERAGLAPDDLDAELARLLADEEGDAGPAD